MYNGTKIVKYEVNNGLLGIELKRGAYYLDIEAKFGDGFVLKAPVKGDMNKDIIESISSIVSVTLKKRDKIIFRDTSRNCGLEIVN